MGTGPTGEGVKQTSGMPKSMPEREQLANIKNLPFRLFKLDRIYRINMII
jgi:hypothetical protein